MNVTGTNMSTSWVDFDSGTIHGYFSDPAKVLNYNLNPFSANITDEYRCETFDSNCLQIPNKPSTPWSDYSTFKTNHNYPFKFLGTYSFNYEENDTIRYRISWGDGGYQTTNFFVQNITRTFSHRYTLSGYFNIRVQTQLYSDFVNESVGWSSWSNYFTIHVTGAVSPAP